ncbi:anthranilate synthase component 1 [Pseudoglutamicibacter albus]|uniref:Anthranilate synthase component 1 n=1 Tax=Pseudoglutamicibacter albus TaxID=98671 RepID=A0ABU1Z010_9MICC|nr:anthranilate synthase component I [Pseudoglutamicibacter albus]MDR7293341.1 anthranilate synthase component 1 [Pseudoglutamicibacter albus]
MSAPRINPNITREEFVAAAASPDGPRVIPVTARMLADGLTPLGVYRRLADERPGTFLLESATAGQWARYSFIGAASAAMLTEHDGQAVWEGNPPVGIPSEGNVMEVLRESLQFLNRGQQNLARPSFPFVSGLMGYIGWDAVRYWETLGQGPADDMHVPMLALQLVTDMAVYDHLDGSLTLVANAYNKNGLNTGAEGAYEDAVARLQNMAHQLGEPSTGEAPVPMPSADVSREEMFATVKETWAEPEFMHAIETIKDAIVDGEVFQAVVGRRFELPTQANALDVYRILRATNPSPYMYVATYHNADAQPFSVVGSSPEALVTVKSGNVVTHPIAGSRPRGTTPAEDEKLAKELLADPKERSEHLMLVDLSRNDLSKVCTPGTVDVTQFMEIVHYSHIMHMESTVTGQAEPHTNAYDVLRAVFPAGTLSGAPKPRALQLLDELEPVGRGIYGGVVGYFDSAGDMDMAIAIRTAVLKDRTAYVSAGAGIVADSQPESEALETVNKSFAPLRAVWLADQLSATEDHGAEDHNAEDHDADQAEEPTPGDADA